MANSGTFRLLARKAKAENREQESQSRKARLMFPVVSRTAVQLILSGFIASTKAWVPAAIPAWVRWLANPHPRICPGWSERPGMRFPEKHRAPVLILAISEIISTLIRIFHLEELPERWPTFYSCAESLAPSPARVRAQPRRMLPRSGSSAGRGTGGVRTLGNRVDDVVSGPGMPKISWRMRRVRVCRSVNWVFVGFAGVVTDVLLVRARWA